MRNYTKENLIKIDKSELKPGMLAFTEGENFFVIPSSVNSGSVTIEGKEVIVKEGYVGNDTLTIPSGSVEVSKNIISVNEGYVEDNSIEISSGKVEILDDKVIVTEGFVENNQIELPLRGVEVTLGQVDENGNFQALSFDGQEAQISGNPEEVQNYYTYNGTIKVSDGENNSNSSTSACFELVKITEYTPYQASLSEIEKVTVRGPGNYETAWGDAWDYSVIDGEYIVTEETKNLSGTNRVYKQNNGPYFLRSNYADYTGDYWYISEYVSEWPEESTAYLIAEEIPNGENSWMTNWVGGVPITTTIIAQSATEEKQMVLKGEIVTKNEVENDIRYFLTGEEKSYSKFETQPIIGAIHCVIDETISNVVYHSDKIFLNGLNFFNELNSSNGWKFSGAEIVQDDKRKVFQITDSNHYAVLENNPGVPLQSSPRTMSFWFKSTGSNEGRWCGIGYGSSGSNCRFTASMQDNYPGITLWADDYFQHETGHITDSNWHHYVYTYDGKKNVTLYVDKQKVWEWETGSTDTVWQYIHVGDPWESYANEGRYADLYIYNNVISSEKISDLYNAKTV